MICSGLSKFWLVAINSLLSLLGLGLVIASAYGLHEFEALEDMFSKQGLVMAIAGGAIMFLISFLGCYGAMKQNKCMLSIYLLFVGSIFIVYICSALFIKVYINDAKGVVDGEGLSTDLKDTLIDEYRAFQLKTYNTCCFNVFGGTEAEKCKDDKVTNSCYESQFYDEYTIAPAVCKLFSEFELDDVPLVGDFDIVPSCGGGDPLDFLENVALFVEKHMKTILIFAAAVGVIQFLSVVFTCSLLCANREEYDPSFAEKKQKEAQAGTFTGTGGPTKQGNANYLV